MPDNTRPSRRELDELAAAFSATYLNAIVRGDTRAAEAVLRDALGASLGAATVFARIVQPAMEEIGDAWQRGDLSVAEEHLATGVTMRALAAVYPLIIEDAPQTGPRVLLASVGGDLHSVGLRMVSDTLDASGFETIYLGADVPADEIASAVVRHTPQLVGLSVTMPLDIPELERAIVAVGETDPAVSIMLGGRGLPRRLRAYRGYVADTEAVVTTARALLADAPVLPDVAPDSTPLPPVPRVDPLERQMATFTRELADVARQQARRAREYRALALTDDLTGLPNRRAWDERFAAHADDDDLTLVILDLDGFKEANDRNGHMEGDVLLQRAATAVRGVLRGSDFAARLGGDEFGILLRGVRADGGRTISERIRAAIAAALAGSGVTASVGVAPHRTGDRRATMLAADQALYRAKARGGNVVEVTP